MSENPRAVIVDLSHGIPPHDIRRGAEMLESAYRSFPRGSVFVCVVDPGVGTDRGLVCVKTRSYIFLAPDNGLLWPAVKSSGSFVARRVEAKFLRPRRISRTFHGRDILAPVAARLAARPSSFSRLGHRAGRICELRQTARRDPRGRIVGEITAFDRFGNALTGIRKTDLSGKNNGRFAVFLRGKRLKTVATYGDIRYGLAALWNSAGFLELAARERSARKLYGLKKGQRVIVLSEGKVLK